ncbi:hypothetical protein KPY62_01620 [Psychrobacter sp. TAE2020]|uniref:hypothetical protein n=1 Tax=Psychrobacter sp. TAE2020 TaxID=2846762 RepID=UPI001C116856|nr:hypothetical protein [Psychrobacter sp. TAE2020]MBU5615820.1 hypothetical protein [Psychrobacter sp. TAE2020]
MCNLDIYGKAEIGKGIAGIKFGDRIENFLPLVKTVVDGNKIPWTTDIYIDNESVLMYIVPNDNGNIIYFSNPELKLGFNAQGSLDVVIAGKGYKGEVFEGGVKIGSRIGDIKHPLVLDDSEDVHYLMDEDGEVIHGIYFVADGLEVDDDPDQKIQEVRVYNHDLK